jgi:cellulase/cellobiase CelA1
VVHNQSPSPDLLPNTPAAGTWFHFAYVQSGSNSIAYLNGVQNVSIGSSPPPVSTNNSATLGSNSPQAYMTVSKFKIYNFALNNSQV